MSRGPLEVLREVASFMAQAYPSFSTADEMRGAIAQIEALCEAADSVQYADMDGALTDELMDELRLNLQPFIPGQCSEGGGNG